MIRLRTTLLVTALSTLLSAQLAQAENAGDPAKNDALERGKAIAFDRNKGNCLSCHMMDDGELPGNSAPPLLMMQARFPQRDVLRAQIYDASERNPETIMPPYGRHHILSEEELELVVDYVHTL